MICAKCRDDQHGECLGTTWCDCQHRTDRTPEVLLGVHTPAPTPGFPDEQCVRRDGHEPHMWRFDLAPRGEYRCPGVTG